MNKENKNPEAPSLEKLTPEECAREPWVYNPDLDPNGDAVNPVKAKFKTRIQGEFIAPYVATDAYGETARKYDSCKCQQVAAQGGVTEYCEYCKIGQPNESFIGRIGNQEVKA